MKSHLDVEMLDKFSALLRKRIGFNIQKDHHELNDIIQECCKKYHYEEDQLYHLLETCPENKEPLSEFVAKITIGETYFFRDTRQMELLSKIVLPSIIKKHREDNHLSIRIWSAGCSSGEEIYTIAIMLRELLPDIHDWQLSLLGTDINTEMLHKAVLGRYTEWSMRNIPEHLKQKYFTKIDKYYQLVDEVKNLCDFSYMNLHDNFFPIISEGINAQDLIVCRNVLIYFDTEVVSSVMKKIDGALIQDGYLLLGASDPIDFQFMSTQFSLIDTTLYQKLSPIKQAISIKKPATTTIIASPIVERVIVKPKVITKDMLETAMDENNWDEVLSMLRSYEDEEGVSGYSQNLKATALANLGKLVDAAECCKTSLQLDSTNKFSYLIYAMILSEENKLEEAIVEIKKAIFLDKQFVIAHYQLGLLQIRLKQLPTATKSFLNALEMAKHFLPNQKAEAGQGITYERLAEIIQREIEIYTSMEGS